MRTLRWILTVPAGMVGWYAGVIVALMVHSLVDRLCPQEHVVSGACFAPWSSFANEACLALGAVICGALVVALPAWVAPAHRFQVAATAYGLGLLSSLVWVWHGFWGPPAWAALGGAVALGLHWKKK